MPKKTTKTEAPDVRVGDLWKSTDPREGDRRILVTRVTKHAIYYRSVGKDRDLSSDRARFNGKRGGFALAERGGAS